MTAAEVEIVSSKKNAGAKNVWEIFRDNKGIYLFLELKGKFFFIQTPDTLVNDTSTTELYSAARRSLTSIVPFRNLLKKMRKLLKRKDDFCEAEKCGSRHGEIFRTGLTQEKAFCRFFNGGNALRIIVPDEENFSILAVGTP